MRTQLPTIPLWFHPSFFLSEPLHAVRQNALPEGRFSDGAGHPFRDHHAILAFGLPPKMSPNPFPLHRSARGIVIPVRYQTDRKTLARVDLAVGHSVVPSQPPWCLRKAHIPLAGSKRPQQATTVALHETHEKRRRRRHSV